MEVDPAVVGGVIAGVVGVGLGVGAMIFTEQQTLRREERRVGSSISVLGWCKEGVRFKGSQAGRLIRTHQRSRHGITITPPSLCT